MANCGEKRTSAIATTAVNKTSIVCVSKSETIKFTIPKPNDCSAKAHEGKNLYRHTK